VNGWGAYCLTEPGAGSDANSGKTTANFNPLMAKTYKINGKKCDFQCWVL